MWRALLLASVHLVSGYWNRDYGEICNPHDHTEDGKFYCSDFYQGWWNGGAGSARISGTQCYTGVANRCWCTECADGGDTCDAYDDEKCLRKSCHDSNCQCPDCGNTWTQCIHSRCDDATEGWDADFGRCFYTEPGGNKIFREPSNKDYCYKRKVACDPSVCAGDERLTGCKRISSGACTPCPDPQPPGKFYYGGGMGAQCALTPCTPCAYGQYASTVCGRTNDNTCAQCQLSSGRYLLKDVDCQTLAAYQPCDACTVSSTYNTLIHQCPAYDDSKGYTSTRREDWTCLPCRSCPTDTYFINPDKLKCMTLPATQCKEWPMPFVFGKLRVPGVHNPNVNHNHGDTLPSYQDCNPAKPEGFVERGPTASWLDDCDFRKVGQCDAGRYPSKDRLACPQCPNAPDTPVGSAKCLCADGMALEEDVRAFIKGSIPSIVPKLEQKCYNCSTEVWVPRGKSMGQERVVCLRSSGTVRRCTSETERVLNNACVPCPAGTLPTLMRDACVPCRVGAFFNGAACVPCDGRTHFCDRPGLLAPLLRNTTCTLGQMLVINENPETDNTCVPCPNQCSAGHLLVYASGRNGSNACSQTATDGSETRFFTCYPPDGSDTTPGFVQQGHRLRFEVRPGTQPPERLLQVDACAQDWLPPHAEWVDPGTVYPLGCVFACRYGWNATLAQQQQTAVREAIVGRRPDLAGFWDAVQAAQPRDDEQKQRARFTYEKVLWPKKDAGVEYQANRWEQRMTVSVSAFGLSAAYARQNTFLYLEESGPVPDELCLAPATLKTTPCPFGFFTETRLPCALLARTQGLYQLQMHDDAAEYIAVVDATDHRLLCHVPAENLWAHFWGSYASCSACLDGDSLASSTPMPQAQWLQMRKASKTNWYAFGAPGTCEGMTCVTGAVTVSGACVPCDASSAEWAGICSPMVFNRALCMQQNLKGNSTITKEDVCMRCSGAHASRGVLRTQADMDAWVLNRPGWEVTPCMYICDEDYTSNTDEVAYRDGARACVACAEVVQAFADAGVCGSGAGESYFDVQAQLRACRAHPSFLPFVPSCTPCGVRDSEALVLRGPPRGMALSNDACLALCDEQVYFTRLVNGSKALSPVPQALISRCESCGQEYHLVGCNNLTLCVDDYFWNGTACRACNASACDASRGLYRTRCRQGAWFDSACAECDPQQLLFEQDERLSSSASAPLRRRRWPPPTYNSSVHLGRSVFQSAEGCLVTCVNNFVWTGLSTNRNHSSRLQPGMSCEPCPPGLYSVWNYSRGAQGRLGACYRCPPNTNTIAESDGMCESLPGFGQPIGTPTNITVATLASGMEVTYVTVPSLRMPHIRPSNQVYFLCCGKDVPCRLFTRAELDVNQASLGPGSAYDRCTRQQRQTPGNATNRRRGLLQADLVIEQCRTSQYNGARGDNNCYNCPQGSSTPEPFVGILSREQCLCLSGYYRHAQTGSCVPCGLNRHRSVDMNESACAACPPGMTTPSTTSTHCYCEPGLYLDPTETCSPCPAGSYCEGGSRVEQCPLRSTSARGARTRSDCVCEAGYYGSLALPGSECRRTPFAQACETAACACADGWQPLYNLSADGLMLTMRCVSECALGEYAQIEPGTFRKLGCVKCPLHTYSSSRQTVEVVGQQCTPCPLNFETADVGQSSVLACACRRGVLSNASTVCGMCAAGSYLDTLRQTCQACPAGSTSPAGSIGMVSCTCPSGSRLKSASVCEPCPRNTYSSSAGVACTLCPSPMVTAGEGSRSFADCRCPEGYYQHAGRCISVAAG